MVQRLIKSIVFLSIILSTSYFSAYTYLRYSLPNFSIHTVTANPDSHSQDANHSLPFFGVMTPVPKQEDLILVPQLEYRQGPPKRYLSKIKFMVLGNSTTKEHIEYFGRRTLEGWTVRFAERWLQAENFSYASFVAAALRFAATGIWPENLESRSRPIAKLVFLYEANRILGSDSQDIYIMDQAGIPAFLFQTKFRTSLGDQARIWFFRRNMLYEIKLSSSGAFSALHPQEIFQKSFLVETRQDALAFVASELSDVQLNTAKLESLSLKDLEWPLLLLGAKLSVDPSSIHAFFHFAGLNALLFREHSGKTTDIELIDSIRNNVLVSERYGRDVAPESQQSAEMGRLARALVKMF